uniref:LRRC37A/B like protein 1 C-terminal domain-containing protein n=1 Tax=Molossus molossus TaxID=27622 RepID=A0A7J8CZB2_MOLMO|nr:hypothetical protein HJG59_009462 [Molossus molossus]
MHVWAFSYRDIGKTQVSLTTVNKIIMKCPRLEKLILPKHLACCLCQFKIHIEAITETVKLNCENQCLANAACDEKLLIEGPFMKVINGRRNNNTELVIQPEVAQAMENVDRSGNFINLLMKLLREQQEVKVSKSEWDTPQWDTEQMNERTEGQGEQELQEPSELTKEEPGPDHINKLLIASPVIAVAAFFFVIFCFFLVCTGTKPRGSDESSLDQKKARSLWKRLLFSLKSMFEHLAAYIGKSVQDSSEESSYKSEGSVSVTATTRTYAEETPLEGGQENEA